MGPDRTQKSGKQGAARGARLRDVAFWRGLAVTYAISLLAGFGAALAGIPLPYMLGPFFLWAALSLLGHRPHLVPMGRELGQVTIGVVVGLRFTLPILLAVASLLPQMVVATLYLLAITMSAAALFAWLARCDHVTAFFATAAGGVADMAMVAQQYSGNTQSVAIVHAMRVSVVVATVPLLVFYLGTPGAMPLAGVAGGSAWLFPLVLALAYLGARGVAAMRLIPNPWLVAPIFVGIALGVSGLLPARFPGAVIIAAQLALGTWLGSQFRREELAALPRVTLAALAVSFWLVGGALLGAVVLAAWSGLPFATAFLSLAPAAVTEMVLTAKVMNLEAEAVTAFHVMRIAFVSTTVLIVFKLYMKLRGVPIEPRI
jgi:membrane AbrB-like protein